MRYALFASLSLFAFGCGTGTGVTNPDADVRDMPATSDQKKSSDLKTTTNPDGGTADIGGTTGMDLSTIVQVDLALVPAVDLALIPGIDMTTETPPDLGTVAAVDMTGVSTADMTVDLNVDMTGVSADDMSAASPDLSATAADLSVTPAEDMTTIATVDLGSIATPDLGVKAPVTHTVHVAPAGALMFSDPALTIAVGDTVHWVFDFAGHTVTSGDNTACTADGKFCDPSDLNCATTPTVAQGGSYDHLFTTAGTFPYHCRVHCGAGMVATVTVQ